MKKLFLVYVLLTCGLIGEETKIACVGDSITYGARVPSRQTLCYPNQLNLILGKNYVVKNFGLNGATLLKKGNLPYWKTGAYKNSLKFNPNIVIIKLGTNDSKMVNWKNKKEFIQDDKDLIKSYRDLPSKPRVIVVLPVPAFMNGNSIDGKRVAKEIVPMIRLVALSENAEMINLHTPFIDDPRNFPDKIHPGAFGAEKMAWIIFDYLKRERVDFDIEKKISAPVRVGNFHGYKQLNFKANGASCIIVKPKKPAKGLPWVWRARFFGHEPQADLALLEKGFHIAFCNVANLFGNKTAVERWNKYYSFLTEAGLAKKPVLEGMSRGGLIIYNWAKPILIKLLESMGMHRFVTSAAGLQERERVKALHQPGKNACRSMDLQKKPLKPSMVIPSMVLNH